MKLYELFEEDIKSARNIRTFADLGIVLPDKDDIIKPDLELDAATNPKIANIESLEGCPDVIRGKVSLRNLSKLQSLIGGPKEVGSFRVMDCDLRSLEGFPKKVESGNVTLTLNPKLGSLKGLPDINGELYVADCGLTSLEGCPEKVKEFSCARNPLTSLEHCPRMIDDEFIAHNCKLESLHNIHKHIDYIGLEKGLTTTFDLTDNPIKSHILGLLKIKGNFTVNLSNVKVKKIINKYLRGNRNMLECQQELIDAGFEEFAQL